MSLILYTCLILTGLGSPLSVADFFFDTSFEISHDCLKQRKSYEKKEEKRKKGQRNCLYVFGKIVCFILEQIPALNHSFGRIFQNCPSSFFIFFYLVFLQKWGKNLAIVLSKSHRENWMRLSDVLIQGWRLKKYKVTWSCTSSANNCGLKPLNLKSRPKLPNLWQ